MRNRFYIVFIGLTTVIAAAMLLHVRWDMTDDHRYSLHPATLALLDSLNEPVHATLLLTGELNAGFLRLQSATRDLLSECALRGRDWTIQTLTPDETVQTQLAKAGYQPILIHEHAQNGKTAQTTVFPYVRLEVGNKTTFIPLLQNIPGLSGEENLNNSIENLEYAIAENLHSLSQTATPRIAFLEGHGELTEAEVYDVSVALSRYFQIDRGTIGTEAGILDGYAAVVIADPQLPFEEKDKYILDQYLMQGGSILWLVNGVRFSEQGMQEEGFTPAIPLDVNLEDMFFRYGVKIRPALVQDLQCLNVPVNVSTDEQQPNFQPVPWFYAPLLLTSETSPVTRHLGQLNSVFASPVEMTAAEDGLHKQVLAATSSDSRLIPTPAKVDLMDFNANTDEFQYRYLPVAVAVEGSFPSVFAHRQAPRAITAAGGYKAQSKSTKQVIVGCGTIARNDWVNHQPLPAGYDRYTKRTFSNRDFIVNSVLWLTDTQNLIELRQKQVALRLLNEQQVTLRRKTIQILSVILPVGILALVGSIVIIIRKRIYTAL